MQAPGLTIGRRDRQSVNDMQHTKVSSYAIVSLANCCTLAGQVCKLGIVVSSRHQHATEA
jgi:hypothetical protein